MNYIPIIYNLIMILFGSTAVSIFFHEIGHMIMIGHYTGKFPRVSFENFKILIGEEEQIRKLKDKQKQMVYFAGIITGLYSLIHLTIFYNILIIITIPIYFIGCRSDIKNMTELMKK